MQGAVERMSSARPVVTPVPKVATSSFIELGYRKQNKIALLWKHVI